MKKIIFILSLVTFHFSLINSVSAQSALGLTAIPPRLEVSVKPGSVVTKEIKVRNDSSITRQITFTVKDFIVTDSIGTPIVLENISETSNRWAASSWIQLSTQKVLLKPNETKSLMVTVIAPDKATVGGHYAMVLQTPDNGETSINGTGSAVTTRIGTLLYISVPGKVTEQAQVKSFSSPPFLEFGPVNFQSTIVNLSDIHILPIGSVIIKDILGFKIGTIPLPETRIFPLTERNLDISYPQKWLLGRFSAQLTAVYGTQAQLLSATTFFWVIPWRLIVLVIATLVVVYALIVIVRQQTISQSEVKADKLEKELEQLKKKYQDRK